jgi:hypothetical protein
VKILPILGDSAPLDPNGWAPESDDEFEDEDEEPEMAVKEEEAAADEAEDEDEKDSSASANEAADEEEGMRSQEESDEEGEDEEEEEDQEAASVRRGSKRKHAARDDDEDDEDEDDSSDEYSLIDADEQSAQSSMDQGDGSGAGSAEELPPIDLRSLRQAVARAETAATAAQSKLLRCKKKLKHAVETVAVRQAIQRAIMQKTDELTQLRRDLAATR